MIPTLNITRPADVAKIIDMRERISRNAVNLPADTSDPGYDRLLADMERDEIDEQEPERWDGLS